MKKFTLLASLFLATPIFANQLHNYTAIKTAVSNGKLLRIVIDYTKCDASNLMHMTVGNHDAIFTPNEMTITNEGGVGGMILYFTMKDPQYPAKAIYQYIRYAITPENTLKLYATALDAVNYAELGDEGNMSCQIDTAYKVFSLS